ncbi:MAG: hypothetical protein ACNI25_04630 [Halarcobacter sp.]
MSLIGIIENCLFKLKLKIIKNPITVASWQVYPQSFAKFNEIL